jgi:hypothetical protein
MMSLDIHPLQARSFSMPHRSGCVLLAPLALRITASLHKTHVVFNVPMAKAFNIDACMKVVLTPSDT